MNFSNFFLKFANFDFILIAKKYFNFSIILIVAIFTFFDVLLKSKFIFYVIIYNYISNCYEIVIIFEIFFISF